MSQNGTALHERVVGYLRDECVSNGYTIEDESGRVVSKLAEALGVESAELRPVVRVLEEAGYVSKHGSATRTHEISLTEKGKDGPLELNGHTPKPRTPRAPKPKAAPKPVVVHKRIGHRLQAAIAALELLQRLYDDALVFDDEYVVPVDRELYAKIEGVLDAGS